MSGTKWHLALALTFGLLATAGCSRGPRLAKVEGTVLLDGKPLDNVLVEFLPEANAKVTLQRSTGRTDAEGRFQLICDNQLPGATVGSHVILVHDLKPFGDKFVGRGEISKDAPRSRVPERYVLAGRSPLRQEVQEVKKAKEGPQTVQIALTTP